jgi:DNA repair exonuclease SbcCD ATPase subunit
MKICSLELKGIRHFSQKRIDFAKGLNIVCGPNESGKSTVLDSLLASFLKPPQEEIDSLKQWNANSSEVTVTYETDSGTFTVTRILHPVTRDLLQGEELLLEDCEEVEAVLEEHTGIGDRTLFENSAVVRQNEMQILQEEGARTKVRDQVKTLLSGVPERSTDDALEFLRREIAQAESFLYGAEERMRTIESEIQQYTGIDEEFQNLETRLTVYQGDLARDQSRLSGYEILLSYRKKETEYRNLAKILEAVENLEAYIERLPVREKELAQELQQELERISEHQDSLIEKKTETREELRNQKAALSVIDDELEGVTPEKRGFFGKLASLLKSSRSRREELSAKRVKISQEVARLEDLLEQCEEEISGWRAKFQQKGEQLSRLIGQCREYENWTVEMLEARKKEYESKIKKTLQGMSKEELVRDVEMKRKEADDLRADLVKTYADLKERKDIERVSIEKEKLAEIIIEWKEKITGLKAQMELISEKVEKREYLTKELSELKKKREENLNRKKADEIAYNAISLVYQELKEKFAPELKRRTETLLSRITQKRYEDITVTKEDLDVLVKVPEKRKPVSVEVLSQGTRDQLYLCLRIALSELLSGDRNPPLLFDEAFYTFDEDRLKETFEVLKEIAQTTQVIVFTHDESYAEYGNSIRLEGPKK